jgi:hypothetical protein
MIILSGLKQKISEAVKPTKHANPLGEISAAGFITFKRDK